MSKHFHDIAGIGAELYKPVDPLANAVADLQTRTRMNVMYENIIGFGESENFPAFPAQVSFIPK